MTISFSFPLQLSISGGAHQSGDTDCGSGSLLLHDELLAAHNLHGSGRHTASLQ